MFVCNISFSFMIVVVSIASKTVNPSSVFWLGIVFMLFPQGTISDLNKNKLSRIKSGAFFISAKTNVPIVPVFLEQPRPFKKTRVVYGRPMYMEGAVENGKVDKKVLEKYRLQWQQEVFKLQDMATQFENRPIRKLKLKPKHQNNNE